MHDRAVRESGHDTSYRLERRCANLATIDLNALLYKYEMDIALAIQEVFDDSLDLVDDFTLEAPLVRVHARCLLTAAARLEGEGAAAPIQVALHAADERRVVCARRVP